MKTKTLTDKIGFAPRVYGNPFFDCMEAPRSLWPDKTTVKTDLGEYEIPTDEVWESGDWISRKYAGIKFPKCFKALNARGIFPSRLSVIDSVTVRCDPSYTRSERLGVYA